MNYNYRAVKVNGENIYIVQFTQINLTQKIFAAKIKIAIAS